MDSEEANPTWIYEDPGAYSVKFEVSNGIFSDVIFLENHITVFDGETALLFDGDKSDVTCPAAPSLNMTENITTEAWILPYG